MSNTPTPYPTGPPAPPVTKKNEPGVDPKSILEGFGTIEPAVFTFAEDFDRPATEPKLSRTDAVAHVLATLGITEGEYTYDELEDDGILAGPSKQVRWFKEMLGGGQAETERHGPTGVKYIVESIVAGLPEEALYESVIGQLDPSQLIMRATDANPTLRTKQANDLLAQKNAEQVEAVRNIVATNPSLANDPTAIDKATRDWQARRDSTNLDVSPAAVLGARQIAEEQGATAEDVAYDPTDPDTFDFSKGASTATALLSQADIQNLFRTDYSPTGPFSAIEQAMGQGATTNATVKYSNDTAVPPATSRAYSIAHPGKTFTITEAQTAFYNMSKDELSVLQQKLKNAGYFDSSTQVDEFGRPTIDEPMFAADPLDNRFRTAWLRVVGDAVRSGSSIVEMLDQRSTTRTATGDYDENGDPVDKTTGVSLTDSMRIKDNSDAAAIKLIGRPLEDNEQQLLVSFIHNLETRKQKEYAGFQGANKLGNDPGTFEEYDVNAQIDGWIKTIMPLDVDHSGDIDDNELWTEDSLVDHILGGDRSRGFKPEAPYNPQAEPDLLADEEEPTSRADPRDNRGRDRDPRAQPLSVQQQMRS